MVRRLLPVLVLLTATSSTLASILPPTARGLVNLTDSWSTDDEGNTIQAVAVASREDPTSSSSQDFWSYISTASAPTPTTVTSSSEDDDVAGDVAKHSTCTPSGTWGVDNGILLPTEGQEITVGEQFAFYYCSPAYHDTTSVYYNVYAYSSTASNPDQGQILATNITSPSISLTISSKVWDVIEVWEEQIGYANSGLQFARFRKNVTVTE